MVILTEDLILSKTFAHSLSDVRHLNLMACELDNVAALKACSNLEVLSLSVNNLSTLEQLAECESAFRSLWKFAEILQRFVYCKNLKELYLRKNFITDADQVKHLTSLRSLEILWLCDNPCADDERQYRYTVLRHLPWLKKLDHHDVTDDEVLASMNTSPAAMPLKIRKRLTLPAKLSGGSGEKSPVEINGMFPLTANLDLKNEGVLSPSPVPGKDSSLSDSRVQSKTNNDDSKDLKATVKNDSQSPKINANDPGNRSKVSMTTSSGVRPLAKSPDVPSRFLSRTPPVSENNSQASLKMTRTKSNSAVDTKARLHAKSVIAPLTKTSRTSPSQDGNTGESNQESNNNEPRQASHQRFNKINMFNFTPQSNVLNAVLALIDELDEKELQVVKRRLQLKMLNCQGQPG
ncbi:3265_t:CDS:2, partial [Acaulospora morrowiae]